MNATISLQISPKRWRITASKNMATAQAEIQNKIRPVKRTSRNKDLESYEEILDEMSVRKNIKAEQIKLSSEEDLESLLKLAEDLSNKISKTYSSTLPFKYLSFFTLMMGLLSLVTLIFFNYSNFSDRFNYKGQGDSIFLTIFFFCLLVCISSTLLVSKIKKSIIPDKMVLSEVLQLLREVHGTIAEREDWSILKRAEFRFRLSRFDLSEKKESVFNFFS